MNLKKDIKILGNTLVLIILLIIISFYKGNFMLNLTFSLHLFFSYVFPGYLFVTILLKDLKSYEKIILGGITWMGISGFSAYYLNWVGLSTKIFAFIFPIISILVLGTIYLRRKK